MPPSPTRHSYVYAKTPQVVRDITFGNNDYTPSGYTGGLYRSARGYDMASGLGAPHGQRRVASPVFVRPARILVRVPADVHIYINGEPTRQASEERLFISPPLPPGRTLGYDLRLETTREGKLLTRTERVEVRAGETTEVNLEAPTAEAAAARTPPAAAAASAGGDE